MGGLHHVNPLLDAREVDGDLPHFGTRRAWRRLGRNGIGRFYETFGNSVPDTMMREVGSQARRDWFRMNPPTPKVLWSLRNNTNLMQSALVVGLHNVATHKDRFLRTFYDKGKRAIDKPQREGPAAWAIPAAGPRPRLAHELVHLLRQQTIEVQRANESFEVEAERRPHDSDTLTVKEGDWIVRMDQPYSRLADQFDAGWVPDGVVARTEYLVSAPAIDPEPSSPETAARHEEAPLASGSAYEVLEGSFGATEVASDQAGGGRPPDPYTGKERP